MFGLDWRIPYYRECIFYLLTCGNWREVIQARRGRRAFNRFELRSGTIIEFTGEPPWIIFKDVWYYKAYTRLYHSSVAPEVVVDIGANIGNFSLFAATKWPQSEIWAYEPAPVNFSQLSRNVELNTQCRIKPVNAAVSGKAGKAKLLIKQESGAHSLYSVDSDVVEGSLELPSVTLEDVVTATGGKRIDFLKVDCEGAEYDIFAGREEILRTKVKYIAMEYHEQFGHHVGELGEILRTTNFNIQVHPVPKWKAGLLFAWNTHL